MLSTQEIQAFLDRITYKPGWKLKYYDGRWEGAHMQILCEEMEDSFNPGQTVPLDIECFLSPNDIASEETLMIYLMYRLGRVEIHEMREWFKLDGKVVSSPHMPNADHDTQTFGVWRK